MTGYDYYEFPCNATIPDVGIRFSGSSLNFPINVSPVPLWKALYINAD